MAQMIRTKIANETKSGNRRGWTKHVTSVDTTKTNGYAFHGPFVNDGQEVELPVGAVVVQQHPEGSVKHGWNSGRCYTLGANGELYETDGKSYNWRNNFLSFRDHVAAQVDKFNSAQSAVGAETVDPMISAIEAGLARINSEGAVAIDPRVEVLTKIRSLMAEYGITVQDIQ